MAEENEELQDSQNLEEEAPEEQPEAPLEGTPEGFVPKDEFDKVFARAKKAEEKLKEGRTSSEPVEQKAPSAKAEEKAAGISVEQVLQLRNEGYTEGEILNLSSKARNLDVSMEKLLSDETFKAGILVEREKAKVESATPAPSSASPKIGGKTFEEMTPEERKKNWDAIVSTGAKSNE